jgi:hypothetical protein
MLLKDRWSRATWIIPTSLCVSFSLSVWRVLVCALSCSPLELSHSLPRADLSQDLKDDEKRTLDEWVQNYKLKYDDVGWLVTDEGKPAAEKKAVEAAN